MRGTCGFLWVKQTGHLDLRSVVDSAEEVMELLSFGNQMRTVAATRSETTPREQLGSLMAQKHWLDSGQLCAQATTMRGSKFHELTSPRYMMSPFPFSNCFPSIGLGTHGPLAVMLSSISSRAPGFRPLSELSFCEGLQCMASFFSTPGDAGMSRLRRRSSLQAGFAHAKQNEACESNCKQTGN